MIRERQLVFQIRAVAAEGAAAWRAPTSPAAAAPSPLLQRRCRAPLAVRIPHAATGIEASDTAVYVRSINVLCRRPSTACAAPAAAAPRHAPCRPAPPAPLQRLNTPPTLEEQPAKRTRLFSPQRAAARPGAAVPAAAPGHLIAPDARSQASSCGTCGSASSASASFCQCGLAPAAVPVVVPMPPLPRSSCPTAQPLASSGSSSPLIAWLQRIKSLLSPRSQHHTPVYVY